MNCTLLLLRGCILGGSEILKSGANKKLREEFPEIEEYLWGDSFWTDGYFAETVGIADEEMIRRYIREQ